MADGIINISGKSIDMYIVFKRLGQKPILEEVQEKENINMSMNYSRGRTESEGTSGKIECNNEISDHGGKRHPLERSSEH